MERLYAGRDMRLPTLNVPALLTAALTSALATASLSSAQTAAPSTAAPATATPARVAVTNVPSPVASALAVQVSSAVKGQLVRCPAGLKVSGQAVCLYVKSAQAPLRPAIRTKLAGRALTDWKTSGKAASLLVADRVGGPVSAFVMLTSLSDTETLVVVEAVKAAASARAALPAGVVKGEPYVLGSDLAGVVNVTSLGGGKYRLAAGSETLTVTVGAKNAQLSAGTVQLPLAPATDGKNLIFPLSGLRSLGCTVTPAGNAMTVACGAQSVGLKPIVF